MERKDSDINMTTICKNCQHDFKGNFCNNCGQSVRTHDINAQFLWHDIQHGLFHFDNGLFYTIKSLFIRPGYTIRDFIDGKRVRHFKPISFVIFLATLYGLLKHFADSPPVVNLSLDKDGEKISGLKQIINWLNAHYAVSSLLLLIIASLSTYLAFKKQHYNFLKHLVLNCYLAGLSFIFSIAILPFLFITEKDMWEDIRMIPNILGVVYTFWAMYQIFDELPKRARIGRTVLSYIILGLIYFTIALMSAVILGVLLGKF